MGCFGAPAPSILQTSQTGIRDDPANKSLFQKGITRVFSFLSFLFFLFLSGLVVVFGYFARNDKYFFAPNLKLVLPKIDPVQNQAQFGLNFFPNLFYDSLLCAL